ncbi:FV3-083R, partial [Symbiodinium pilosum]
MRRKDDRCEAFSDGIHPEAAQRGTTNGRRNQQSREQLYSMPPRLCDEIVAAVKLLPNPEYTSKQPRDGIVPRMPCTGIFLGPSKSGKTVALISASLEQYRTADGSSVFERIYIFSP